MVVCFVGELCGVGVVELCIVCIELWYGLVGVCLGECVV